MSQTSASRAANAVLPPTLTGNGVVTQVTTSSTAATKLLGTPATGKYYVTVQAVTTDAFIAFKLGNAAASVTTTTGLLVPTGASANFYINPATENCIEAITASAAGSIKFYLSSPLYEQSPQ